MDAIETAGLILGICGVVGSCVWTVATTTALTREVSRRCEDLESRIRELDVAILEIKVALARINRE